MKHLLNVVVTLLLGWPALILGYLTGAVRSGFNTGLSLQDMHEVAAIKEFCKKQPQDM